MLALDGAQARLRLGLRQDHRGRPAPPQAERQRPAAHVEHREHRHADVFLTEAQAVLTLRGGEDIAAMRREHSLGAARGSARVEHDVGIVLVDRRLRFAVGCRREQLRQGIERKNALDGFEPRA